MIFDLVACTLQLLKPLLKFINPPNMSIFSKKKRDSNFQTDYNNSIQR